MNPLKKGEEEDLEAEGREVVRNLEKKSKKQKEKQLSDVKADYIMKSLKRKANEKYEIEDLTEEQIKKSLKSNEGKSLVVPRPKKVL